ncbi:helix-turn-helix domain-containing protein [Paremcibacter congregatus]|uniref:helix-turn-helix domain-containing protein n=1 Tax=Paremcibacter congregatus TaxID=2043170 RepID=UPI003A93FFBA
MYDNSDDREEWDTDEPQSPFLTTREAADYLRLKPNTLEQKRMTGDGPAYRDHGVIVYHRDDLDNWSEAQRRLKTDGRKRKAGSHKLDGEGTV